MDEDDAYIHVPHYEDALDLSLGVGILLMLLPTLIWLTWVMLRSRR
ncbi:hypothetical protein [Nonomuraea basaltis]|nr:hypothetical protein [Nonomuraea basaltis]